MSIINKPDYKVFAQDAKSGEIETFPDVLRGWGVTLDRTAGKPPLEWFNSVGKRVDEWLMYLSQRGLAEWDSTVDYPQYAAAQHAGKFYVAIKENREQQPDHSQSAWKPMSDFIGAPKSVLDALNTKQDKGDYATNSALKTVNDNANSRLAKNQNGADIPDKNAFVKNLGLSETVNKANNAVPSSRKINGKALSGDVSLSAGDVGAISVNPLSTLTESKKFQNFLSSGFILVNVPNTATVNDFPFPTRVYGFGILEVRSSGVVIYQKYTSHHGEVVIRQSWNSGKTWIGWDIVYSSAILPPEQHPVGAPIPYPHRYTPVGYLTCNGQTFDKSLYPKLAEAYPSGRVPDLRGEFIRGWDDSRGVDPGRVCGSWQDSDNKAHIHDDEFCYGGGDAGGDSGTMSAFAKKYCTPKDGVNGRPTSGWLPASAGLHSLPSGGNEARPRNVAFNYIVRAA
ncbi:MULTISPECIES: phage tail protein [Photorhabdus]|uniref:Similarities with phage tail fiber protein n=2 Tax=Photorhabdus asymbiotica TaxID=291112 RepID=C7BL21_PHOAA|nr:phage tail protein [Photorhabdus asymbiotica]CAQ85181.1 similarities with phage tail fiber protein [Photorhabdus asymbiotica]CAQ85696.1 similarities with tail fiber protein [Photorhabdus asymbiotica]